MHGVASGGQTRLRNPVTEGARQLQAETEEDRRLQSGMEGDKCFQVHTKGAQRFHAGT